MYIRATHKLREYKYSWVRRNYSLGISLNKLEDFMDGDHMEIDDIPAQQLIDDKMAQKVAIP